jgi:hypothetical protein
MSMIVTEKATRTTAVWLFQLTNYPLILIVDHV